MTVRMLAETLQVSSGHVGQVLARLHYHRLARRWDGGWCLVEDHQLVRERLDAAATLQATGGCLAERGRRYRREIDVWQASTTPAGALALAA